MSGLSDFEVDIHRAGEVERQIAPRMHLAITLPLKVPGATSPISLYVAVSPFAWSGPGGATAEDLREIATEVARRLTAARRVPLITNEDIPL